MGRGHAPGGPAAAHGAEDPGKTRGLVRSGDRFDPVRVFAFVKSYQGCCPIATMCRVLRDSSASVACRRRLNRIACSFGPELHLSIRTPRAESECANNPRKALDKFRSADTDGRHLLALDFSKYLGRHRLEE